MPKDSGRPMRSRLGLTAALFAIVCASCTSMGRLDTSAPPPDKDHAYFLIGVKPVDARVIVFKGEAHGGRFTQDALAVASFYGNPVDGFAFGDTHAGTTLAIMNVQIISPDSAFLAATWEPCGGAKTIVFNAPEGKVVYVGSVEYARTNEERVVAQYREDLGAARAFLQKHYPNLAGLLEQGSYQLLPAGPKECSGLGSPG